MRVPHEFIARMRPEDPHDPLLLQVIPLDIETTKVSGYSDDPLAESRFGVARGLLSKYATRKLLITTGACGVHCRYCFRRHFPYSSSNPRRDNWESTIDTLRRDRTCQEIILSGGDPLTLSDYHLAQLLDRLETVAHLKRLRIHTRLPVVLPSRVDERLLDWVANTRLKAIVVLHINHPNEIDGALAAACQKLRGAGATLLNQSVLLRNINDTVPILAKLSEQLFDIGVLPYYLHVLDPVAGAAHFDVPDQVARTLVRNLRFLISGYLVPRLVREVPGESSKTPLL